MEIKKRKVIFIFWAEVDWSRRFEPPRRGQENCRRQTIAVWHRVKNSPLYVHTQCIGVMYSYSVAETLRQWRVCIFYHSSFFFSLSLFLLIQTQVFLRTFYAHVPLKMLTLSSAHVSLNANAAWCDSRTLRSLYKMASSLPELQRKPLDILQRKKGKPIELDYWAKHSSFQMSHAYVVQSIGFL